MATKLKEPAPRNLGSEMGELMPYLGQLATKSGEAYQANQQALYEYQLGRLTSDAPTVAAMQRNETARDRTAAIDFLGTQGQAARAAHAAANPELYWTLGQLNALASDSEIYDELHAEAMDELSLGRALSPEQERAAVQAARTAGAVRGMATGTGSAVAEILARDNAASARQAERRNFAAGVEGLRGQQLNYLGQAHAANSAADPAMQILIGTPTNTAVTDTMQFIQGVRTPDPTGLYTAGFGYASDLFNTNNNAAWSQYYNKQNLALAKQYGSLGYGAGGPNLGMMALGGLGGAAAGALSGAAMGSVVPGIGTAVGAVAGGLAGGLGGLGAGM